METDCLYKEPDGFFYGAYRLGLNEHKFLFYLALVTKQDDPFNMHYFIRVRSFCEYLGMSLNSGYSLIRGICSKLEKKELIIAKKDPQTGGLGEVKHTHWITNYQSDRGAGEVAISLESDLSEYLLLQQELYRTSQSSVDGLDGLKRIKSTFTFRLYEILKTELLCSPKKKTFNINTLRRLMGIGEHLKSYSLFKENAILVPKREMAEKCDICFDFSEIKAGRVIDKLEFSIRWNTKAAAPPNIEADSEPAPTTPADAEEAPKNQSKTKPPCNPTLNKSLLSMFSFLNFSESDFRLMFTLLDRMEMDNKITPFTDEELKKELDNNQIDIAESLKTLIEVEIIKQRDSHYYFNSRFIRASAT